MSPKTPVPPTHGVREDGTAQKTTYDVGDGFKQGSVGEKILSLNPVFALIKEGAAAHDAHTAAVAAREAIAAAQTVEYARANPEEFQPKPSKGKGGR